MTEASSADGAIPAKDPFDELMELCRQKFSEDEQLLKKLEDKIRELIAKNVRDDVKFKERGFYKDLIESYIGLLPTYESIVELDRGLCGELKHNVPGRVPKAAKNKLKKQKKLLFKYLKRVDKLDEQELTLDDLANDNSAFIKLENLEKKILTTVKNIRKLEGKPFRTGGIIEKKFVYDKSEHQPINEAITKLVTGFLFRNKRQVFARSKIPDIGDIRKTIEDAAEKNSISLPDPEALSRKILRDIGEEVKRRRQVDTEDYLKTIVISDDLTENVSIDHAQLDPELDKHQEEALNTIRQIHAKYCKLQEERGNEGAEEEDTSGEDSAIEAPASDDDEPDEDDDLEELDEDEDDDDKKKDAPVDAGGDVSTPGTSGNKKEEKGADATENGHSTDGAKRGIEESTDRPAKRARAADEDENDSDDSSPSLDDEESEDSVICLSDDD